MTIPDALLSACRLPGQVTPDPSRAPCRGLAGDSCCGFVYGRCVARGHRSLNALCEGGGDGHHVHPISSDHLLADHLLVCHPSAARLSAAHRVGRTQAHSSEYTYPHPYPQYQRFHPLAPSMEDDRDPGPDHGLYIHVDDLISIRRLHLPRSEKMEGNPAVVTWCQDANVTSRVSDHWDVVDSSEERIRSLDEARRFDGIGSCRRNYLRSRMVCYPHLRARRLRRTLLVREVDLVLVRLSSDDQVHVILRMLVFHLDLQGEGSR